MTSMRMNSVLMGMVGIVIFFGPYSVSAEDPSDPARDKTVFKLCSTCHQVGDTAKNAFGPVLNNIVGRQAGSYPGYIISLTFRGPPLKRRNKRHNINQSIVA